MDKGKQVQVYICMICWPGSKRTTSLESFTLGPWQHALADVCSQRRLTELETGSLSDAEISAAPAFYSAPTSWCGSASAEGQREN